jgi:hypothetical protein
MRPLTAQRKSLGLGRPSANLRAASETIPTTNPQKELLSTEVQTDPQKIVHYSSRTLLLYN